MLHLNTNDRLIYVVTTALGFQFEPSEQMWDIIGGKEKGRRPVSQVKIFLSGAGNYT